jgi:DNA-binding IscR family transcriptional regulator
LESKEGKNGGYEVTSRWNDLDMYQLLQILDEDKHMVQCLGDKNLKCNYMINAMPIKYGENWKK